MNFLLRTPLEKKLFFFSVPLIFSLVTQQLYSVVDMVIVGKFLGANELAAVGNAGNIVILFIVVSGGFELSAEIIFSRYIGKKDEKGIATGAVNMLVFGVIVGILLAISGFFLLPAIIQMMNVPANLVGLTKSYSFIYMLGVPAIYAYDISRAMITSLGDSKKSFYLVLSSTLLNIVLDLLFVVGFKLGVAGAALATILAQMVFMVVSTSLLYKKIKTNPYFSFKPSLNLAQIKEILYVALPSIFQQFVVTLSALLLQAFVNPFGREIIIGYLAVTKINTITRLVVAAFSQTLSIYSAQMFAGKEYSRLKETYHFLVRISLIYSGLVSLIYLLFPGALCNLFFDPQLHPEGLAFLKINLLFSILSQFFCVYKYMNENLLRSALKMRQYLICNIGDLGVRLLITYALISLLTTNVFWFGEVIGRLFAMLISFYFIHQMNSKIKHDLKIAS